MALDENELPRIVRVKLSVYDGKIITQLASENLRRLFEAEDDATQADTELEQAKAKDNYFNRKTKPLKENDRTWAVDYDSKTEPKYDHAGIHLRFNGVDQIIWYNEDDLTYEIKVGPDPELYRFQAGDTEIPNIAELQKLSQSSFSRNYFVCQRGFEAASGPLIDNERVKKQQYYRFFMATKIGGVAATGDPHYEGH
jgi:hypothetical protein